MPRRSRKAEYESWDWTKQDVALAEQHGLTRERIRQIRGELCKEDSLNKRRRRKAITDPCGKQLVV